MLICVGTDRPTLKYLNKYVKAYIATKWNDIGAELLDVDELDLKLIKGNHPGDSDKCTAEMLKVWLTRNPEASWDQLLETFRKPYIGLNALAVTIEEMLSEGMCRYIKIQYMLFLYCT